jgi:1-acyl-sn-glycerol-3-phosphate acyltransferase
VLLFKARAFGLHHVPEHGGVLLVSNHQSFMDPVLAGMPLHREGHYMARDSLFNNPWFGRMISSFNAFPVRRNAADISAIKETLRRLKNGQIVLLFPEGTRSPDGRIHEMLPGVGAIAKKARVPVVPMLIDGVYQTWPRDQLLPRPGNVIIEYGSPLNPDDYADMSAEELMEEIRRRIVDMQQRWHSRQPERRLEWYNEVKAIEMGPKRAVDTRVAG